ncbi:hypothetical protein Ancab_024275 [Ancistrocladus abbreviatus]
MATNTSRLIVFRSASLVRWMTTSTSEKAKEGTLLFRKLTALGLGGTDVTVADTLDEWVKEGHRVKTCDVTGFATQLRRFKKYEHAIQLYEWMFKSKTRLRNADHAIHIDLLAKTQGITAAENYFNSLEGNAKTKKTYGALLNCYCHGKMLEKATKLFQKMRELNLHTTALNYNNMMALYVNVGQPEKVSSLFHEMKEKLIMPDLYTYNQLMNSYAAQKDFEAVERVMELMKSNNVKYDWFTYGNLATIYVNAGLVDKANAALEKLEKMKNPEAFHTLINLYGRTSNASGVNRAWDSLKLITPKPSNLSYLIMLLALSRLGDVDGLEKCFREWESACSNYDVRVSNVLLESYLNRDMINEANLLFESLGRRGVEPNLRTLDLFMNFHLKNRQMDLALRYLEAGASKVNSGQNNWFPNEESGNAFIKYFEEEKDTNAAEKFSEIMKKMNRLDPKTEKLVNTVHQ